MKIYFLTISMFIASLFSFFWGDPELAYKKDEAKMNKIINSCIKQLSQKYGLIPIGRGGGITNNKSRLEAVSFQLYENMTKDQIRFILIDSVECFLNRINNDKEITHYLHSNPFTYRNLDITIFVYHPDRSDTHDPEVGVITSNETGNVTFRTYDSQHQYASSIKEPYEEAYRIATNRDYPKPALPPVQSNLEASSQNK